MKTMDELCEKVLTKKRQSGLRIGDTFNSERLGVVTVIAIHRAGTVDVKTVLGQLFRISGLHFSTTDNY